MMNFHRQDKTYKRPHDETSKILEDARPKWSWIRNFRTINWHMIIIYWFLSQEQNRPQGNKEMLRV